MLVMPTRKWSYFDTNGLSEIFGMLRIWGAAAFSEIFCLERVWTQKSMSLDPKKYKSMWFQQPVYIVLPVSHPPYLIGVGVRLY